jgi:hypothetical protein
MKSQLLYGADVIMSIIDNMIRKYIIEGFRARSTQKLKRNWSKYDLMAMFWTIEKYNMLYGKKTGNYVRRYLCRMNKIGCLLLLSFRANIDMPACSNGLILK